MTKDMIERLRATPRFVLYTDAFLSSVLETALEPLPEPGDTIIELNKRVRALQLRLEKARKAGFADQGDD
jgi:hypothetical protein